MQRRVSREYGVLLEDQGIAARATFIIDKQSIIRHLLVNDLAIRRSEQEILRVLKVISEE